jgi:hypothetical protein
MREPRATLDSCRPQKEKKMAFSMDILSVIQMPAPKGAVPNGMKVTSLAGPDVLQPAPSCPALGIGSFTLWPMSYIDNRFSFGMVMYDPMWKVISQVEKPGARYVYQITLDGSGTTGSVKFSGQSDRAVTMSLDEIYRMLCC